MKIICEDNSCEYWRNYYCTRKGISVDTLALCNEHINLNMDKKILGEIQGKYLTEDKEQWEE